MRVSEVLRKIDNPNKLENIALMPTSQTSRACQKNKTQKVCDSLWDWIRDTRASIGLETLFAESNVFVLKISK